MRRTWLALAGLLIASSQARAGQDCREPYAPDVAPGAGVSRTELLALRDDVQAFIQASDIYQQCLVQRSRAFPTQATLVDELLQANQRDKERVGRALNDAIAAFKNAQAGIKTSDATN